MTYSNKQIFILVSFFNILFSINAIAQRVNQKGFTERNMACRSEPTTQMVGDETYDVKHYHLDVEISINTEYIKGNVLMIADAVENISFISLDLDDAYTINSIDGASSYTFSDDEIIVTLDSPALEGEEFTLQVYYEGIPPLAGGYKGLRYETHGGGQPIIASLSTPYLAHTWWPCNDGTKDKADSVYVDITIDDMTVSGIQVQAISNGILDEVVPLSGGKLQYKWKHNYPIVPYYVMVAISNYRMIEQTYDNGSESFPLDYYVFNSSLSSATAGVAEIPAVLDLFTNLFGPYPFADEKYGMTQLGYYGAIENQTNTIINSMSESWFLTSVHELAHMWFADMITCSDWHHGWVNEGFATYAEALWIESSQGVAAYHNYVESFEYYSDGSVYMPDVSNPFTVFQSVIYNKGAYVLHMLRHVLDDATFFEVLQEYSSDTEFQYKWATTENFKEVCETVSGLDLTQYFDQWIYDEYYPKYKFDFYQDATFNTRVGILQTQGDLGWRDVFEMPIDVTFEFADTTETTIVVQNNEVFQIYDFSFEKEVVSVSIDRDNWILKNVSEGDFSLSIDQNPLASNIVVYPNPIQDELFIKSTSTALHIIGLEIININGSIIESIDLNSNDFTSYKYDSSKLATGVYYLNLKSKKGLLYTKFIVQ